MKRFKKIGLGLVTAPILVKFTVLVVVFVASFFVLSAPQHVDAQAYQSGEDIKFRDTVYAYAGIDTRSGRDTSGWAFYLPENFSCGNKVIVDNPATEGRVSLRDTFPYTDAQNPIIGDCWAASIDSDLDCYAVGGVPVANVGCVTGSVTGGPGIATALENADTQDVCENSANGTWTNGSCDLGASRASTRDDASSTGEELANTCESRSGAWGWLLCSGIDLLDGMINWVDNQIQRLLEVNQDRYTNDALKRAWATLRNISYMILIPIMLVMVIGTAIGLETFSAYTVRKALPRMVIAIIFIALSWYICVFMIGMFNAIGSGVVGLVTAPFRAEIAANEIDPACADGSLNLTCLFSTDIGVEGGAGILRGIATTFAQVGLILGLVVFLVWQGAILLLGAVAAFLVLFAREMFILGLMLMAPLAILAWIFPGNDKLWKMWWNSFSKLLMMFPLIMGIIAVGRIFAWIINESPGGALEGSVLHPIMKLTAYLLPYAFIPFTFKMAGGVFANLAGIVNDKDKGLIDRAKNLRGGLAKKGHETLMDGKGRFGSADSRLGNAYRRSANFGRHGSLSPFGRGKSRWEEYEKMHREKVADKLLEEGGGRAFNDDDASALLIRKGMDRKTFVAEYSKMLREGRDSGKRADLQGVSDAHISELAENALSRSEQAVGARAGSATMRVAAQKFRTAMTNTAYDPGKKGLADLQKDLKSLQDDGLITDVDAAGWMKSNRGRADFSANGFSDTISFAGAKIKADGSTYSAADQLAAAFRGADPREVVGSHQRTVEGFAEQAEENLKVALASGSQRDIDLALADVANIFDTMSNISTKKAQVWADKVYSMPTSIEQEVVTGVGGVRYDVEDGKAIPIPGPDIRRESRKPSVRELMDQARTTSDTFLNRRREYGSARDAHLAGSAAEATRPPDPPGGP